MKEFWGGTYNNEHILITFWFNVSQDRDLKKYDLIERDFANPILRRILPISLKAIPSLMLKHLYVHAFKG